MSTFVHKLPKTDIIKTMSLTEPTEENYLFALERLQKEVGQENFRQELLASVPEDEPNRDKLLQALNAATAYDANYTVQADFIPDKRAQGQVPLEMRTNLSKRDFSRDPKNQEKYGADTLRRVTELIMQFSSTKLKEDKE